MVLCTRSLSSMPELPHSEWKYLAISFVILLKFLLDGTVCAKHWSSLCEVRLQHDRRLLLHYAYLACLPFHDWPPRAHLRHQFCHRASFDVSASLASALLMEDLATLVRLITVSKLITLCALRGSPCAPPIAPLPLPRTTNRQAVLPVNCPSFWRTPLVGFVLACGSVAHLLAILARLVVYGCFCCLLAYDRDFLQALCRFQPSPLLPSIQSLPSGQLWCLQCQALPVFFFIFAVHG